MFHLMICITWFDIQKKEYCAHASFKIQTAAEIDGSVGNRPRISVSSRSPMQSLLLLLFPKLGTCQKRTSRSEEWVRNTNIQYCRKLIRNQSILYTLWKYHCSPVQASVSDPLQIDLDLKSNFSIGKHKSSFFSAYPQIYVFLFLIWDQTRNKICVPYNSKATT